MVIYDDSKYYNVLTANGA